MSYEGPRLWRTWFSRPSEREFPIFSVYPPEPSLLWRDYRLFLRIVCIGVVMWLFLWLLFLVIIVRVAVRQTEWPMHHYNAYRWCRTVLCGDGGRRGDTSDPRRTSRMEWTKGSSTGWTGKPYRKQEGGPKAERRTDQSKRPGGSLSPAPAATRSISICIT